MEELANNMHFLAEMNGPINVTHRFKNKAIPELTLSVIEIYSFPFNTPGVSQMFFPPEWAFEYHYAYAGKINFLNPGEKFTMEREEGMVHLYAPGCLFTEDTRESALPRQETYMRFKGGELCGLQKFTGGNRRFCRFLDRDKKIGSLLEKAAILCSEQGEGAFWEEQSLLLRCVSIMLKSTCMVSEHTFEISDEDSPEGSFVENAESYIRQNIHRTIKNSELAQHINMSESAFNHRFKEKTGSSPKQRILEIKIETAKSLLLKGKRLQEVAGLTGFHDEFHLSRTFKKITGDPPSAFRLRAGRRNEQTSMTGRPF
jgi:AraC-like DNA-binding protein